MKQPLKGLIAGIVIVLAITGCAPANASASRNVVLNKNDAGREITMRVDDQLTITLPGNLTTGYSWEAQPPVDGVVLVQQGEPEFKADSNQMGSGGQITLVYKAAKAGQSDLTLVYHRSWEKGVAPKDTFAVKVTVSE